MHRHYPFTLFTAYLFLFYGSFSPYLEPFQYPLHPPNVGRATLFPTALLFMVLTYSGQSPPILKFAHVPHILPNFGAK